MERLKHRRVSPTVVGAGAPIGLVSGLDAMISHPYSHQVLQVDLGRTGL